MPHTYFRDTHYATQITMKTIVLFATR